MTDDKRLGGMRNNPRGDWTIGDVEALCRSCGVNYRPPNKGSHAKVSHPSQAEILTIPFARPIKPVYIKRLVKLVDAVVTARALQATQDALVNKDRKT